MTADAAAGESRPWQTSAFAALALGLGTTSSALVRFHEPVIVTGLWGRTKTAAAIAVPIDDVDGFMRAVEIA